MKLFNVCIDIDGTLSQPDFWIEPINMHFGTNLKYDDVIEYDIDKALGISKEAFLDFYVEYASSILSQSKIRPFVQDVLMALSKKHELYYVTARDKGLTGITKNWLNRHQLPGQVYLLGSHHKVEKAIELACDIFIEDRYENAIELAKAGFDVYLLDCNYNRKPLIEGITRVNDWNEIKQLINNKERLYIDELQKAMS